MTVLISPFVGSVRAYGPSPISASTERESERERDATEPWHLTYYYLRILCECIRDSKVLVYHAGLCATEFSLSLPNAQHPCAQIRRAHTLPPREHIN